MKNLFLILFSAVSILASAQTPTLYFKITAQVTTTDSRTISSGAVVSFKTYPESISGTSMPCDLSWWISEAAQDSGYAKINPCTDIENWNSTRLDAAYLTVTVPAQQFSYTVFQGWAKTWLETIFGVGNVTILN